MTQGAYILQIDLVAPLEITIKGKKAMIGPGRYLYCGSAKGPGGVEARVARHRRQEKKLHWHIDQITTKVRPSGVGMSQDLSECDFVEALLTLEKTEIVISGFGSSDCRACPAHFVKVPKSFDYLSLGLVELPEI